MFFFVVFILNYEGIIFENRSWQFVFSLLMLFPFLLLVISYKDKVRLTKDLVLDTDRIKIVNKGKPEAIYELESGRDKISVPDKFKIDHKSYLVLEKGGTQYKFLFIVQSHYQKNKLKNLFAEWEKGGIEVIAEK